MEHFNRFLKIFLLFVILIPFYAYGGNNLGYAINNTEVIEQTEEEIETAIQLQEEIDKKALENATSYFKAPDLITDHHAEWILSIIGAIFILTAFRKIKKDLYLLNFASLLLYVGIIVAQALFIRYGLNTFFRNATGDYESDWGMLMSIINFILVGVGLFILVAIDLYNFVSIMRKFGARSKIRGNYLPSVLVWSLGCAIGLAMAYFSPTKISLVAYIGIGLIIFDIIGIVIKGLNNIPAMLTSIVVYMVSCVSLIIIMVSSFLVAFWSIGLLFVGVLIYGIMNIGGIFSTSVRVVDSIGRSIGNLLVARKGMQVDGFEKISDNKYRITKDSDFDKII